MVAGVGKRKRGREVLSDREDSSRSEERGDNALPSEELPRLNVMDMAIGDVVALMRSAGCNVKEGIFEAAIEAGAPVRPDGRLNLLELIGWLLADQDGI